MKALLFANTDWYLYNFRLPLARRLRDAGFDVVLMSPRGPYSILLEAERFEWVQFDVSRRGASPLYELGALARLVATYYGIKPDVVHHFTIKCVLYGSLAARVTGVKQVINAVTGLGHLFIDDGAATRLLRPFVERFYRIALTGGHTVFQNSDDAAFFVDRGMVSKEASHLIRGSGVDPARFTPRPGLRAPGPPRVLFAGRLLRSKGIAELMEAARILHAKGNDIVIRVAGDVDPGNPASVTDDDLRRWKELPNVEWLGHRDDMERLYQEADVVALPSYREGTPKSLLEAAACGLPLITTDAPGCREIVRHGENGLLIPPKDAVALATALTRMCSDLELRTRMGAAGRKIVRSEFSEAIVLDRTLALYPTLTTSRKGS